MTHPPRISRDVPRGKRKPNLRRKATHLAFIRLLPCVACGLEGFSQATHVRNGADGGTGLKSSDRFNLPLCGTCHMRQHARGEVTFWGNLGIDPLDAASRLWTVSGDVEAGERIVFRARQSIELRRE